MSERRKLESAIGLTEQQKRFIGGDAPRASQDSDAGASSTAESRPAALSGGILVPITTRLQPLTTVRSKPAVPVGGEPLVRRILAWLSGATAVFITQAVTKT